MEFLAHLNAMFGPLEERIELIESALRVDNLDDIWRLRLKARTGICLFWILPNQYCYSIGTDLSEQIYRCYG